MPRISHRYDLTSTAHLLDPLPLDVILLCILPHLPLPAIRALSLVSKPWRTLVRPLLQQHLTPSFFLASCTTPSLQARLRWPIFIAPPGPTHFYLPLDKALDDEPVRILHAMQHTKGWDRTRALEMTIVIRSGGDLYNPPQIYPAVWRRIKTLRIRGTSSWQLGEPLTFHVQGHYISPWPRHQVFKQLETLSVPYSLLWNVLIHQEPSCLRELELLGHVAQVTKENGYVCDVLKNTETLRVLSVPLAWVMRLGMLWDCARTAGFRWRLKTLGWMPTVMEVSRAVGGDIADEDVRKLVEKWIVDWDWAERESVPAFERMIVR